jgi:hypothetical protein
LNEVPPALRDVFVEAPYLAAEQVFETALSEGADALLLAGDVVDVARAGPPSIVFLVEQFSRLADRGIPVFWAGGSIDPPHSWPPSATLPENVHLFPVGHVEDFELRRGGRVVARIQGASASQSRVAEAAEFHRDPEGLFTVGVAYGTNALPGREGDRVHYMALGGRHQRGTVDCEPGTAHYSGTPQGRGPREVGPHGCTLVQIDETGHVESQFVATDTVRWLEETVEITASTRSEELEKRLEASLEQLQARHRGVELLIRWRVCGVGPLVHRLRVGGLADEMVDRLRRTCGERSPAAYTATIVSDSPLSVPAEWYDEQTVIGDFLREFDQFEKDGALPLELARFLPEGMEKDPLAGIAKVRSRDARNCLLQSAVKLGVDLIDVPVDEALDQQAEEAA